MSATLVVPELLRRHQGAFALAGVALLVLGSWLAASAYHERIVEQHVAEVAPWTERSSFTYSVPVTRNSTHWPIGTTLPMGEPAYFRTISDSMDFEFAWDAEIPSDARGVAAGRLVVLVSAQTPDGRPYWSIEHTLDEATVDDATEGLRLHGTLDLDSLVEEVSAIGDELPPGEGTLNWTIRATVVYAVDSAARRDQGEVERILVMGAADPRFTLPSADDLHWEETHTQQSVRVVQRIAGIDNVLSSLPTLGLILLGLALMGAAGLAGTTRAESSFEREYRPFRDWVSVAGEIPDAARESTSLIEVRSLEDLVHVAADARTRVLLNEQTREFFALLPGVTYRYGRHATTPVTG